MTTAQVLRTLDQLTATMTRPTTSRAATATITPRPVCTSSCTCPTCRKAQR